MSHGTEVSFQVGCFLLAFCAFWPRSPVWRSGSHPLSPLVTAGYLHQLQVGFRLLQFGSLTLNTQGEFVIKLADLKTLLSARQAR